MADVQSSLLTPWLALIQPSLLPQCATPSIPPSERSLSNVARFHCGGCFSSRLPTLGFFLSFKILDDLI